LRKYRKNCKKSQPNHLEERGELDQLGTIREDEQKPNTGTTTEETEIHQQMNQI
jgi:hypothetical protein